MTAVPGSKTSVGLSPPQAVAPKALCKERGKGSWLQNLWKLHSSGSTTEVPTPQQPVGVQGLHGRCNGCHWFTRSISWGISGGDGPCPSPWANTPTEQQVTAWWSEECDGWMRNLPCLPKGKREGSEKGCCHTASQPPVLAGHTISQAWGHPQRRHLYLAISRGSRSVGVWWLS